MEARDMFGSISGLSDHICIVVSRDEVESGDIAAALGALQKLLESPEIMAEYFERVDIVFHGYDADPRDLSEIEEVRSYVYKLDEKFPFWLFFLAKTCRGLECLLLCLLPPHLTSEGRRRAFPDRISALLSDRWLPAMNHLCAQVGLSDAQLEDLTDRVVAYVTKGPIPLHRQSRT
jgi:hypothetical protein